MNSVREIHRKIARPALFSGVMVAGWIFMVGFGLAAPGEFNGCAGTIKEAPGKRTIPFAELASRVEKADYVLFGERHGVKEQAVASSCVLSAMATDDRPVSLIMEMLSRDDDAAISRYRKNHPETPAGLGTELQWWTRGWPAFDNWLPLVQRAFSLRVPLHGGDLASADARPDRVTARDAEITRKRLGSSETAIRDSWTKAMVSAHCGLISEQQVALNAEQQIRRDFSIADAAQKAHPGNHSVLLQVGRGHSRKDRSLYRTLTSTDASVLTIGSFAEGEVITEDDIELYDYLWIVGKADLADPCKFTGLTNKAGEPISR